jgi:hypothetical protein
MPQDPPDREPDQGASHPASAQQAAPAGGAGDQFSAVGCGLAVVLVALLVVLFLSFFVSLDQAAVVGASTVGLLLVGLARLVLGRPAAKLWFASGVAALVAASGRSPTSRCPAPGRPCRLACSPPARWAAWAVSPWPRGDRRPTRRS